MYEYSAKLSRVIDGDTYELDIDLGFRVFTYVTVRLLYANAPERFTQEGRAASRAAYNWFSRDKNTVIVKTHKAVDTDKYGRWLAEISNSTGSLAEYMVVSKNAVLTDAKGIIVNK